MNEELSKIKKQLLDIIKNTKTVHVKRFLVTTYERIRPPQKELIPKLEEAKSELLELQIKEPDNPDIKKLLSEVEEIYGDFSKAIEYYEKYLDISSSNSKNDFKKLFKLKEELKMIEQEKNAVKKEKPASDRTDKDKHFSEIVKLFLDCVRIQPDNEEFAGNQMKLNESLDDWFDKYPGSSIADVAYNMSVLEMFSSEGITYENLLSDLVRVSNI